MIRIVLCDIEGTTTSLSFVQQILFAISRDRIPSFIQQNWNNAEFMNDLRTIGNEPAETTKILLEWIDADLKDARLKKIQGKIWKESYESGAISSHVYPDVPEKWKEWKQRGIRIYIFSSGSVEAQKLLFQHSDQGDLRPFIDGYFDTTVGSKKNVDSYRKIAESLKALPEKILFLSDIEEELSAAQSAGMQTYLMIREGPANQSRFQVAQTFEEIAV